jgi:small nuclear ribonucleoprotein (snRNP)-like protein
MNLVLDDAEEIHSKTKSRKQLGKNVVGLTEF